MADEKPKTVEVESIKFHTYNGKEYVIGATYDAPAELVESLAINGMALRTDRAAVAKKQAAAVAPPAKAPKARKARK